MASGMSPTAITTGTTSISLSMNWKKLFRRYKRKTRLSKNFILDEVGAEIRLNHYFILLLYDYAPLFPKRGVSLYRTNTLKYAVTTSFDATSLMCPPRYGDGRFLPAYRLGRGGFFRKSGNYMYRRYDGYCISGRAVPLV